MSSTRLPGKVLAEVAGRPMLYHVVHRAMGAKTLDQVVVATSDREADDPIAGYCAEQGTAYFCGSEEDVLDRYLQAARQFEADVIVRLTADCPLLDPEIIDQVVGAYHSGRYDYVSNTLDCTYPDGLDTEVFSRAALERTAREARLPSEREHVTPYMRNHPELFHQLNVSGREDWSHLRWTVDEPADLEFVREVYARLGEGRFGMDEMLRLLERHPELSQLNAGIQRNAGYLKSLQRDRETAKESRGS